MAGSTALETFLGATATWFALASLLLGCGSTDRADLTGSSPTCRPGDDCGAAGSTGITDAGAGGAPSSIDASDAGDASKEPSPLDASNDVSDSSALAAYCLAGAYDGYLEPFPPYNPIYFTLEPPDERGILAIRFGSITISGVSIQLEGALDCSGPNPVFRASFAHEPAWGGVGDVRGWVDALNNVIVGTYHWESCLPTCLQPDAGLTTYQGTWSATRGASWP